DIGGRWEVRYAKRFRSTQEGRHAFVGDHLFKRLACVDQFKGAALHQHLGGLAAGVVAAGHGVAVGPGAHEGHEFAFADRLEFAVFGKTVPAFADRADDIGDHGRAGRIAGDGHDFVIAVIHGGPGEVVHGRVDDEEVLAG